MKHSQSLLLYSHDGQGLGHLKRNYNIACQAIKDIPGSQSLLLTGHSCAPFQEVPRGIDFIKLPSMIRVGKNHWKPTHLPMNNEKITNLRASLIWTTAEIYKPDVFLVDFLPAGIWNELIPTLQMLKERENPPKIIFGIRDIIDDPEITRREWEREGYYEIIRQYYDYVFIYGSQETFDTAYHYGLVGDLAEKVRYCGYVNGAGPDKLRQQVRTELKLGKKQLCVITAGGGGDAYPMMSLCLDAIATIKDELSLEFLIVTGPVMNFEDRKDLEEKAIGLPVKILPFTNELINLMNAADLLITMGGYNTMMDVALLKKPTLVIPRDQPKEEQKIRAQIFSHMGFVNALNSLPYLTSLDLAVAIKKTLHDTPHPIRDLDFNGRANAIFNIKQMLALQTKMEINV